MAISGKSVLIFTLLVFVLTFAIKWFAFNEPSRVEAVKPKLQTKTKVVQRVKITAIVEPEKPAVTKKTDKASEIKRVSRPEMKEKRPEQKKQPLKKKITRRKSVVAKKRDKVINVTKKHATQGLKLLKGKRPVPLLELDFREIGVSRYLTLMQNLGGRIFVADAEERSLLSEAVLHIAGTKVSFIGFKEGSLDVEGLSVMPHEIIDENIVDLIISKARLTFTGEDLRVVVILPVEREAAFIGAIDEVVRDAGLRMRDFSRFSGEYKTTGGMSLHINEGILQGGKRVSLRLKLNLSNLKDG